MPLIPWNDLIPKTTSICQLLLKKFRVTSCLLFFFLVGSSKRCKENRRKEKKKSFQSCQLQESKSGQQERCANEHWFDKNKKFKRFREGEGNLSRRTLFAAEFPMLAKTTTKKKKKRKNNAICPLSMPNVNARRKKATISSFHQDSEYTRRRAKRQNSTGTEQHQQAKPCVHNPPCNNKKNITKQRP